MIEVFERQGLVGLRLDHGRIVETAILNAALSAEFSARGRETRSETFLASLWRSIEVAPELSHAQFTESRTIH